MKKQISTFGLLLAAVVLVGGGCAGEAPAKSSEESSKPAVKEAPVVEKTADEKESTPKSSFAPEVGAENGMVMFKWDVAEGQGQDGFRFFYAKEGEPSQDNHYMYWNRNSSIREHEWKGLPAGAGKVRMCILEGTDCGLYSDTFEVEL